MPARLFVELAPAHGACKHCLTAMQWQLLLASAAAVTIGAASCLCCSHPGAAACCQPAAGVVLLLVQMTLEQTLLLLQGCLLPPALQACHPLQSHLLLVLRLCCYCCVWLPGAAAAAAAAGHSLRNGPHQAAATIGQSLAAGHLSAGCSLQILNLLVLQRQQRRLHLILPLPTALQPQRCCCRCCRWEGGIPTWHTLGCAHTPAASIQKKGYTHAAFGDDNTR